MIYDFFPFLDELDLLEIRLNELYNFVDKFVICEGDCTFSGKKKPFIFEQHKERFKKFFDKIISYKCFPGRECSNWDREIYQRESVIHDNGIKFNDEDIIMVSDVDEILHHNMVKHIKNNSEHVYEFHLDWLHYKFNLKLLTQWTPGVKATSYKILKNNYKNSLYLLRSNNYGNHVYYENAGWHFSYCCNIKNKIESYSHQENNRLEIISNIDKFIENKEVFWNKEYKLTKENCDFLPEYVKNNKEKFKNYII